ncbi:hypothetical protein M427DRAFT_378821 [Gonapodya prolifera JEL478]|uniref:F-box domain-containing protein n=1 Tax=Gonapodya prolifera (strain JEL478) TaxID=1344416 RepID=A0A139AV18_GONPJ|nr:hypothetical protein M427DRAFT_378821 [Gonapodya prolifera JEL478]|eukprot:KXS20586.1 hypothetical protein M427DRAFT_378821 [Gonapodya prolifera JEL478]
MRRSVNILHLPDESLFRVLSLMNCDREILSLCLSCKRMARFLDDLELWKVRAIRRGCPLDFKELPPDCVKETYATTFSPNVSVKDWRIAQLDGYHWTLQNDSTSPTGKAAALYWTDVFDCSATLKYVTPGAYAPLFHVNIASTTGRDDLAFAAWCAIEEEEGHSPVAFEMEEGTEQVPLPNSDGNTGPARSFSRLLALPHNTACLTAPSYFVLRRSELFPPPSRRWTILVPRADSSPMVTIPEVVCYPDGTRKRVRHATVHFRVCDEGGGERTGIRIAGVDLKRLDDRFVKRAAVRMHVERDKWWNTVPGPKSFRDRSAVDGYFVGVS